jgi:glycosyltransferase A (GT-A) superfamily protein (DUF2064 family)
LIRNTAILIFANSAEKDAERKSFLSTEVVAELNKVTLKKVQKTGLPYFHYSERNQQGADFGERFSNAIAAVFSKGFENVITIGNDTPHLKTDHIIKSAQQLAQNNLVLGPSKDGGFYLMGIKKAHFNKSTFLKLPWQTNRLNSYISKISSAKNISIAYLELLNDIDDKEDISKIIKSRHTITTQLLSLLKGLVAAHQSLFYHLENSPCYFTNELHYNKGSPYLLA